MYDFIIFFITIIIILSFTLCYFNYKKNNELCDRIEVTEKKLVEIENKSDMRDINGFYKKKP